MCIYKYTHLKFLKVECSKCKGVKYKAKIYFVIKNIETNTERKE